MKEPRCITDMREYVDENLEDADTSPVAAEAGRAAKIMADALAWLDLAEVFD